MKFIASIGRLALAGLAAGALGCSKAGDSASEAVASMILSGTLSSVSSSSVNGVFSKVVSDNLSALNNAFAVNLSDLEIYAVCFSTPPAIGQANVGSNGSFTVSLSCASGNAVTAIFRVKNSLEEVGQIYFEDSSKKDLSGNNKQSTSVVLSGNTDFGSISINSDGKVVVPVSTLTTATTTEASSGTAYNFNGVWSFAAYEGALPSGYTSAYSGCNMSTGSGCNQPGIPIGMTISLVRFAGKKFTSAAGCNLSDTGSGTFSGQCQATDGTTDSATDVYGVSVWAGGASGSGSGLQACGHKTNFTTDEARKFAGLDLTGFTPSVGGQNLTYGRISYSAATGYGGDTCVDGASYCNKPWMKDNSQARWSVNECELQTVSSNLVRYCKATATYTPDGGSSGSNTLYNGMIEGKGGGCVDSNGAPLRVDNWSSIVSDSNGGSCVASSVSGIQICSYTYTNQVPVSGGSSANFTCSFSNGWFRKPAGSFVAMTSGELSSLQWNTVSWATLVSAGGYCKNIGVGGTPDANKVLARYRCYAENFFGGGGGPNGNGCSPRYRFNWQASDPAQFVVTEGRDRPDNNFLTNIASYSPDGNTIFVNDESDETFFIPGSGSSQVRCELGRSTKLTLKKVSDSQMVIDLSEGVRLISTDAACRASAAAKDNSGVCLGYDQGGAICQRLKENMKNIAIMNKSSN